MKSKLAQSGTMSSLRLAALLTCHNRREKTLACLRALLHEQKLGFDIALDVLVVDDGSTDGTGEALRQAFPEVTVLQGDGSLFWNGGMHLAFAEALHHDYDYYLWLNDDTTLYPGALERMLATHVDLADRGFECAVVVGSTNDPGTGELTYGGQVRASWWHPFKYRTLEPGTEPRQCDTMHGNCVLIPRSAAERVGNIESAYVHHMGDIDYGLRARQHGCTVWAAPGYVGTCTYNHRKNTWPDANLPLKKRLTEIKKPKGLPPDTYRLFARRHAGVLWPLYWALPYIRLVVTSVWEAGRSMMGTSKAR